ncbi:MAG: porin, partial [Acidobacteriota bacterium]
MKKIRINFVILFSSLLLFILNDTIKAETDFPDTKLKLSGFFQFEYFTGHKNANAFRARRARLNLNGEVLEGFNFKLQVDPTQNPSLIDLHLDLKIANKLRFRAGQFKIPFSLENLTSSGNLDTVNRSLTVEYLCPGRDNKAKGRDIGLSLISRLAGIELILGVLNGAGINRMDNDKYKDIAGRLVFSPLTFVSLGSSHYRGKSTLPTGSYENKNRTGFDVVFTINRF